MSNSVTPRIGLPLLFAAQAQKELFHNEALTLLDHYLHAVVEDIIDDPSTLQPVVGQSWIVGTSPVGDWSDKSDRIACWTSGGWRFLEPVEAMLVFRRSAGQRLCYDPDAGWGGGAAIAAPAGGNTVDTEARDVISALLAELRIMRIIDG